MLQAGYGAGADEFREHGYETPFELRRVERKKCGRGTPLPQKRDRNDDQIQRRIQKQIQKIGRGRSKQRPYIGALRILKISARRKRSVRRERRWMEALRLSMS